MSSVGRCEFSATPSTLGIAFDFSHGPSQVSQRSVVRRKHMVAMHLDTRYFGTAQWSSLYEERIEYDQEAG